MNDKIPQVFISYSWDDKLHREKVRNLSDSLRVKFGIDATIDAYDEDNPAGGQLTDFMELIRKCDKVICILSPVYKLRADGNSGGVGYEKTIITSELYNDVGSSKFIPVVLDPSLEFKDCAPNFLTISRKAILRSNFETDEDHIEQIARAVHLMPKNPKPPIGKNKLLRHTEIRVDAKDINIANVAENNNFKELFDMASYYAKTDDVSNFQTIAKRTKKVVFVKLKELRIKYEDHASNFEKKELNKIVDEFIETIAPVFLVAFAGILSQNEKFQNQEALLVDLLSIDGWDYLRSGKLNTLPELLAYVYHHICGALNVELEKLEAVLKIFKYKIPLVNANSIDYEYLYKVNHITGWIECLGRDCFVSFQFLFDAYARWSWLNLLFSAEEEFRLSLIIYQSLINILNFFEIVKIGKSWDVSRHSMICDIPPCSAIAGRDLIKKVHIFFIKNGDFFKNYLKSNNIPEREVLEKWPQWLSEMTKFWELKRNYIHDWTSANQNLMKNILK